MVLGPKSWRVVLAVFSVALAGFCVRAVAHDSRPLKGSAYEDVTSAQPVGNDLQVTTVGAGIATHLGRFTREATVLIHPDGTLDGTVTFTAANGDKLFTDLRGGLQSPTLISGLYTISGGTGRFTGASGSATFDATTADGLHAEITFSGTIRY
jgi:hypothetical protein